MGWPAVFTLAQWSTISIIPAIGMYLAGFLNKPTERSNYLWCMLVAVPPILMIAFGMIFNATVGPYHSPTLKEAILSRLCIGIFAVEALAVVAVLFKTFVGRDHSRFSGLRLLVVFLLGGVELLLTFGTFVISTAMIDGI